MPRLQIGLAIRDARVHRNMTQQQVATRASLPLSYIDKIERGRNQPLIGTVVKFADAMEIEPWKLLRYACRARRGGAQ